MQLKKAADLFSTLIIIRRNVF